MIIKCGICGQEMEVIGEIADVQPVQCPYCGKEFVYRKPTRIDIPTDTTEPTVPTNESESVEDIPELPPEYIHPKLRLRRPQSITPQTSHWGNDLVSQVEARAKAEERKAKAQRTKAMFNNIVALAILAGICFGGYKAYRVWKSNETAEPQPLSVETVIEKVKSDAADAKRAAEAAARAEAERLRKEKVKEMEEAKKRAAKKQLDEFSAVQNGFAGARLAYWSELPKNQRPGACDDSFGLIIPRGRGRHEYFQIASRTDGLTIKRMSDKAPPQEVPQTEYEQLMTEYGGFFLKDGTAYFVSASGSKKTWRAPTRRGESFCPAECVFGDAYPIIGERTINTIECGFDVYFAADEKSKPIKVDSVKFDGKIDYDAFEKVARDIGIGRKRKASPPHFKAKQVKRTVVFYDGALIARGFNGVVTKIPRKPPYRNRVEWNALCAIAQREEYEIQRNQEEARRERAKWQAKMNEPPSAFEISQLLRAGIVTIKRK